MKSTMQSMWSMLGTVLALAAIVSLVKNLANIDLFGLPFEIYKQYATLREAVFFPVVSFANFFSLPFPGWLKDAIVVYSVPAASLWHTGKLRYQLDKKRFSEDRALFENEVRKAATASGVSPDDLWLRVEG